MARIKNSSYVGADMGAALASKPTRARTIRNAIGDTALVYDRVTGENAEATTINHDGTAGRGARLGVPIVNQYIGKLLTLTSPTAKETGDTWVLVAPFFLPTGETSISVVLDGDWVFPGDGSLKWRLIIKNTSGVEQFNELMHHERGSRGITIEATGLTAGAVYIAFVQVTTSNTQLGTLHSWSIHHGRRRPPGSGCSVPMRTTDNFTGVTTPGATEGVAVKSFDDVEAQDTYSLNGYLTAYLNRAQNGLYEYITGWPAGGNASYTHVDHDSGGSADSVDPARSRFFAHTRSLYASEPLCEFPLFCEALGAIMADGQWAVDNVEPPTVGMLYHYAPWPIAVTTQTVRELRCYVPDFPAGGSSALKARVILGSNGKTTYASWTIGVNAGLGAVTDAPSPIDASNDIWIAEMSAIDFTPDAVNTFTLTTAKGSAKSSVDEVCVLGWCLYFDP